MKMSILGIEYKNIRKITDLKLSFVDVAGNVINNNFIMMANGTGKTTTMALLKGLLDGTAIEWSASDVKSFAPTTRDPGAGEFSITVKFDERQYKYFSCLDYKTGTATINTTTTENGGYEEGRHLPDSLKDIFSSEFVSRFVFDGEQAKKTMDSSSNEAEETIKYLYRLDKLDNIIASNQRILTEIQETEGAKGSKGSLSNLKTRRDSVCRTIETLKDKAKKLKADIEKYQTERESKIAQRDELDKNYKELDAEKQDIIKEQQHNKDAVDAKISEILNLMKSPYLISPKFNERMYELASSMTKLKLPKTISKDFFVELSDADICVCGREIKDRERQFILVNAERYLGSDQQSVLNSIKSSLISNSYDERLREAYEHLKELREEGNRLQTRFNNNAEKLLKAGGEEAYKLNDRILELEKAIAVAKSQLDTIESKDESNDELTENNNIHKAQNIYSDYEQKIAAATRTSIALSRKEAVETILFNIKLNATKELKKEIVRKTNEKLKEVIKDDDIEIENIDKYIKLKNRDGASEGQTLGIAYCFLGTLFEDAELEFPFVIDSPTGKMDFDKRQAVADIIPDVFNQMIAFIQPAEIEHFANRFYDKPNTQFITIIASTQGGVEMHMSKEFFDSYQRNDKGDEQ